MLGTQLSKGPMEGTITSQPLVDYNGQGILIAGRARSPLDLLRGHIGHGTDDILCALVTRTLCYQCDAEIAHQYLILSPQQHVFWLHIAMHQLLIVGILQGRSSLFDILHDGSQWKLRSLRMALAHCA